MLEEHPAVVEAGRLRRRRRSAGARPCTRSSSSRARASARRSCARHCARAPRRVQGAQADRASPTRCRGPPRASCSAPRCAVDGGAAQRVGSRGVRARALLFGAARWSPRSRRRPRRSAAGDARASSATARSRRCGRRRSSLACADANIDADAPALVARSAARPRTRRGDYAFNDCTPNCAAGHVHSLPGRGRLLAAEALPGRPRRLPHGAARRFSSTGAAVGVARQAAGKPGKLSLSCPLTAMSDDARDLDAERRAIHDCWEGAAAGWGRQRAVWGEQSAAVAALDDRRRRARARAARARARGRARRGRLPRARR